MFGFMYKEIHCKPLFHSFAMLYNEAKVANIIPISIETNGKETHLQNGRLLEMV